MTQRFVVLATVLCWVSLDSARSDQPELPGKSKPVESRPIDEQSNADSDRVVIEARIIELRGDVQRALKEAGFRQWGGMMRSGGSDAAKSARRTKSAAQQIELLEKYAEVTLLSVPKITSHLGQSTNIRVYTSSTTNHLPYFVRTGETTFELKYSEPSPLGIMMDLTARSAPNERDLINIAPLKISITTLDGREPVPGVDLEIGKPFVSTRTLETSLSLFDGLDATGIVLPGPEGRQPVLLITAQRMREPRPGEPVPAPGEMVPLQKEGPKQP
jgi:hypothetical protein